MDTLDEHAVRTLLHEAARTPEPPSAVDVDAARRRGGRRRLQSVGQEIVQFARVDARGRRQLLERFRRIDAVGATPRDEGRGQRDKSTKTHS